MQTLTQTPSATTTSVTTIALGTVAFAAGTLGVGVAIAVALAAATFAALVDLRMNRIPDEFVVVALLPSVGSVLTALVSGDGAARGLAVVIGGAVVALPLFVIHVLAPRAMGFGDVKLAVSLGAAIGLVDPVLGLVALCVASASTAVVGLATRRGALPFGPGLVFGTVVAITFAAWAERWLAW
ncbi:MAG: prepilin peptidase [Ilumatobacteraceae bacterium]